MPDVPAKTGRLRNLNDRTCFSCVHVQQKGRRRDICGCLFGCTSPDDAEVIYSPMTGECPSWESAEEEIRRWSDRWLH